MKICLCLPQSRFRFLLQRVCVCKVCCVDVMSQVRSRSLERVNAFEPFTSLLLICKSGFWRHLLNKNRTAPANLFLRKIIFSLDFVFFSLSGFCSCQLVNKQFEFYCIVGYVLIRPRKLETVICLNNFNVICSNNLTSVLIEKQEN